MCFHVPMAKQRAFWTTAQAMKKVGVSRTAFTYMWKGASIQPAIKVVKGKCHYYWSDEHIALLRARKGA